MGFEQPLEMLQACHGRIEEQPEALERDERDSARRERLALNGRFHLLDGRCHRFGHAAPVK